MHLRIFGLFCCLCSTMLAATALAARPHHSDAAHHGGRHAHDLRHRHAGAGPEPRLAHLPGGNCVAYARAVTGIRIDGDAGTWWHHAEGRYRRGQEPVPGAVLVFKPHGRMWHGHVAVVARLVGRREILVDQANWVHGRVSTAMSVIDVSPDNDWTMVKVRSQRGGVRANPTFGFVYPEPAAARPGGETMLAARGEPHAAPPHVPALPIVKASLETAAPADMPDRHPRRAQAAGRERPRTAHDRREARHAREIARKETRRAHARELAEARRGKAAARHAKVEARRAHDAERTAERRDRSRAHVQEHRHAQDRPHAQKLAARSSRSTTGGDSRAPPLRVGTRAE